MLRRIRAGLGDQLQFPFSATCIAKRSKSPLKVDDTVEVIGLANEDDCEREIFVIIRREADRLAVPLAQLKPVDGTDKETSQGVEDWHYWVEMGYEW